MTTQNAIYYKARIDAINRLYKDLPSNEANEKKNSPKSLLTNGYIDESLKKQFEQTLAYTKQVYRTDIEQKLSFTDITTYNTWFEMHPEKVCGKEQVTTSIFFPIKIVGTQQDIENAINKTLKMEKTQATQPQPKFKVGDEVFSGNQKVVISKLKWSEKEKTYFYGFEDSNKNFDYETEGNLILISKTNQTKPQPKFKVGDEVKFLKNNGGILQSSGTIVKINDSETATYFEDKNLLSYNIKKLGNPLPIKVFEKDILYVIQKTEEEKKRGSGKFKVDNEYKAAVDRFMETLPPMIRATKKLTLIATRSFTIRESNEFKGISEKKQRFEIGDFVYENFKKGAKIIKGYDNKRGMTNALYPTKFIPEGNYGGALPKVAFDFFEFLESENNKFVKSTNTDIQPENPKLKLLKLKLKLQTQTLELLLKL